MIDMTPSVSFQTPPPPWWLLLIYILTGGKYGC